jgi:glycosyltransferase involved in cell wall biosynthesis
MPVLNTARYLAAALDALAAQTLPASEVIVVDGGSHDATVAIAQAHPGVRVLQRPGTGVPEAHNEAIALAGGDVLAFAAGDDVLEPDALQSHVAALAADPGAGMSVGLVALFTDGEHDSRQVRPGLAGTVRRARVLEAVAVRREVAQRVGPFRTDLGPSADLEWVSRVADAGVRAVDVPRVVVRKRLHSASSTYGRSQTTVEVVGALRAVIERRRVAG